MRVFLLLLALAPAGAQAQMYKCVDERGITRYTDNPCPAGKGKKVDIRPIPPLSGQLKERASGTAEDDAAFKQRQRDRETAEQKDVAAKQAREQRCARMRQNLDTLQNSRRVKDAGKELDDDTREKRAAQLREELKSCP
jgi:flagellar motility protein MotE (MotC chaperone)